MTARWKPRPVSTSRAGNRPVDPAFEWADQTGWRGFAQHAGWVGPEAEDDSEVQITVRVVDDVEATLGALANLTWLRVPATYGVPIPGTRQMARHLTAYVARKDLHHLRAGRLPAEWELSMPLRDADRVSRGSASGRFGPSRARTEFQALNLLWNGIARAKADDARSDAPEPATGVLAVIDFGCPFLHPTLLAAPQHDTLFAPTRLRALWDQGSDPELPPLAADANPSPWDLAMRAGWPWVRPNRTGYGRELGPAVLRTLVKAVRHTVPPIEESAAYRGMDYLIHYDDPRRRVWHATHGAHVLDVAGGRVDPLTGCDDAAGRADLVFVQLPAMTAADSAGGSLAGHVLDGVRYVLEHRRGCENLVVNISYGNRAGPHDGSSFIETALDELLQARHHDFAIVLAAGNSRRQASHAKRWVRPQRSALFRVWLTPGDSTDTFVEFWYAPPPAGWELKARVRSPDRVWSSPVQVGQQLSMVDGAGGDDVVAWVWHERLKRYRTASAGPVEQAGCFALEPVERGHLLLCAAPTAQPSDVRGALAPAGVWEIEVELLRSAASTGNAGAGPEAVAIDAWIERDDPGQDTDAGESIFLDQDLDDDLDTLSSLCNGRFTIVAGGFRRSDGREAGYSSTGPLRRERPLAQVLAACEEDEVQPDIAAAAVRSGEVHRMNGTSVAAPVLARRLYNWLAAPGRDRPRSPQAWQAAIDEIAAGSDGCVRALPAADE